MKILVVIQLITLNLPFFYVKALASRPTAHKCHLTLPTVLRVCQSWFLTAWKQSRAGLFENKRNYECLYAGLWSWSRKEF
jgi:hypothetical protein